jgi:hypothetical protein
MYLAKTKTIAGVTYNFCVAYGNDVLKCSGYVPRCSIMAGTSTATITGATSHTMIVNCAHHGANNVCMCQNANSETGGTGNA